VRQLLFVRADSCSCFVDCFSQEQSLWLPGISISSLYWRLLEHASLEAAGAPMITHISFNLCGEAIMRAPVGVGRPFFRSWIDALKMGNSLVQK